MVEIRNPRQARSTAAPWSLFVERTTIIARDFTIRAHPADDGPDLEATFRRLIDRLDPPAAA